MLKINLFGKIKIKYKNESFEKALSNKIIALIYLMVANRGKYVAKDKIMLYLWPDSSEDAARYNLRYNLWLLKKILPLGDNGETLIISEKDGCILNENYPFECDLTTIKEMDFNKASIDELLYVRSLFCGNIMEGWYLKNCNEFNEMILFDRMMCDNRHMELLKALVKRYEDKADFKYALEILKEMSLIEPDNEEIALKIMKSYACTGNRTAAINYYKNFETILWNNLNIIPNNEINSFYKSLTLGKTSNLYDDESIYNKNEKEKMTIKGYCMSNIDYFLISDIISSIVKHIKSQYLLELNERYVSDLSYIQRELLVKYEEIYPREKQKKVYDPETIVPDVRLIHGFCNLIELVTKYYELELTLKNYKNVDSVSEGIIEYLKEVDIEGLKINIFD